MNFTRRDTLILAGAASVATFAMSGGVLAQAAVTIDQAKLMAPAGIADRFLGNADSKVTVIEYASPTCPHCAVFHNTIYPEFKAAYIDNDKVKFILRPFVRNVLDAVVFMLAEAAATAKAPAADATPEVAAAANEAAELAYHNVIDTYFKTQETWAASESPRDAILVIAKQLGFTEESFDAALTNQELFAGMEALREQALNEFQLTGTPTFYVNGKLLTGEKSLEALAAEIDPLL